MSISLNLQEINQEQAFNLSCFNIRIGQNMLMLGQRGVGKSLIAIQSAIECGYIVNYLNLSVLDRSDLAGLPNVFDKGDIITYKSPYYLPPLEKNQKPNQVLLLDEIDKCPIELQGPLHELLQFRTINDKPLNIVACILTGNLPNENAHSNQISSALLDRCSKFVLAFDLQCWLDWAKLNGIHDLILGFLASHPDLACGELESTMLASPSPRGWTNASAAIIAAKEHKITDAETISHIIAGSVGESAAMSFKIWYQYAREFEKHIPSIIEYGHSTLEYAKLDPTQQLIFGITLCYLGKLKILGSTGKKKLKQLDNICRYFIDNKVAPEIQYVALTNSFPFEIITKYELYKSRTFFQLVEKLQEGKIK